MATEKSVIDTQLDFFRNNRAGCTFAAVAAREPERYGWFYKIIDVNSAAIDSEIKTAADTLHISTFSLVFPNVKTVDDLLNLIRTFQKCDYAFLDQNVIHEGFRCLGIRVRVGSLNSWVSGFGNFDFFPPTRRTLYTEIIFRVKPRPYYEKVMKKTAENVIHLADMYMLGITDKVFKKLWHSSLQQTAQIIGHKPDLRSAAKTTFILPEDIEI